MMDSYSKMVDACGDYSGTSFLGKVNDSGWLGHVKELLHASCLVAQCIATEDACVLVHGTEGVDTTLQVLYMSKYHHHRHHHHLPARPQFSHPLPILPPLPPLHSPR